MKTTLALFLFAFLGVTQCMRIRRQAVEAAPAAGPGAAPVNVPDAPMNAPVAEVAAPTSATGGLNVALGFMVDELEKEQGLGGPVNPAGLEKATNVALKIKLLGGEVDKPTQDKLDNLMAEFTLQAVDPADFSAFAAPPGSSKVDFMQFA